MLRKEAIKIFKRLLRNYRAYKDIKLHRYHNCINCQFLSRTLDNTSGGNGQKRILNDKERYNISDSFNENERTNKQFSFLGPTCRLFCHFGVWDMHSNQFEIYDIDRHLLTPRNDYCFFWEYNPLMSVNAAEILQKRQADNKEASLDRKRAIRGLWIAGIGLIISSLIGTGNLIISYLNYSKSNLHPPVSKISAAVNALPHHHSRSKRKAASKFPIRIKNEQQNPIKRNP